MLFYTKLTLCLLLAPLLVFSQGNITISGYIKEKQSQELLPGVNVYVQNTSYGTVSNNYGFYSLTIPATEKIEITYSFVGYQAQSHTLSGSKNIQFQVEMLPINNLDEVVISAKRQENKVSESAQMSQIEIPIDQIKKIPAFFGEKDVMRVLQLMPGVQKGSEGQTGLYVRGGGPDQNLIILDDAIVYNANHLFGFFSIFNSDALKSVELTKGGFPARYGGRLSSVVEMNMKEGSKDKLHGEGGIGLISSRLTLEGPLAKGKSSFLISGRRTYIDFLAQPLIAQQQKGYDSKVKPGYYFYDLNAKANYDFGPKNKLYISGYFGQDRFKVKEKDPDYETVAGLYWGNATATLRWNHLINQKLFVNTSLIYSHFNFEVFASDKSYKNGAVSDEFSLQYRSLIRDFNLKSDFDFYPNSKHAIKFGMQAISHRFVPSALAIEGAFSDNEFHIQATPINTIESGLYIEDTWQPFTKLKVNAGFRISSFKTTTKNYFRPEPRFSGALKLAHDFSMKASYAKMNQYVHLLSNTGLGLPTDLWVPTTDKIAPQQSEQVAFGFAKDLEKPGLSLTLEGYYKRMNNIVSYKEGSSFINLEGDNANEINWEDNITAGKGWSYGTEFLIQKKTGKFSGWIGYTLSWTKWKFPELNFGETFYPRYDRRHDISVVGIYDINKRITLSATWVYGTGNALTIPVATYSAFQDQHDPNGYISYPNKYNEYDKKNSFRAEAYHRMDVAIQFHKKKKRHERTWEFGLYNAYNRKNPFFYNINTKYDAQNKGTNVLTRYSLFPVLPSFSYNFKF